MNETSRRPEATPSTFSWTFQIPVDVANTGFQIAIFGQDPSTSQWQYWDPATSAYLTFSASTSGQDTAPLINATPSAGSYTEPVSFAVNLPTDTLLNSGVVAMFIGPTTGIPVTSGTPASPTSGTNPNDIYSVFELTYNTVAGASSAILDIDISNVDQVGFTYTVKSSPAPFPLSQVGSPLTRQAIFAAFAAAFPAGDPYHECLVYGNQVRLLAPQDVLQAIIPPAAPTFLNPSGAPTAGEAFAAHTYFYVASESSPTGETAASGVGPNNPEGTGVFGGFLLNADNQPTAAGVDVAWQVGGEPTSYTPMNPSATGINLYRASAPAVNTSQPVPAAPTTGYTLLTSMSITAWNAQAGQTFFDDQPTLTSAQAPRSSSYGFSALATWFDQPLQAFFTHYASSPIAYYQFNQDNGSNGTLWTGAVVDVTPKVGEAITSLQYVDENGKARSISATWQWGDGTQTYKVLQLVGNAYDAGNYSNTQLSSATLTAGQYQGAVLNLYFPYFTGNTGLSSITLPGGESYVLPAAPPWLANAQNGPSHMVFGCAGVFATPNDPDALAQERQNSGFALLAEDALTQIQNVIVSAHNRGVAAGYGFALGPQQYTCPIALSQAPAAAPQAGAVPAGTYTYSLSAVLNDGSETALSWSQTITLSETSAVTLRWLPESPALYRQANVYRQAGTGPIELVGSVANTTSSQATGFEDQNQPVKQPTSGAPFVFYPAWSDAASPLYVPSNRFSAFLHQNVTADAAAGISVNGLVYGYPFDDQGNWSTNINFGTNFPDSVVFQIGGLQ